ncbi:hypothetical protein STRCI_004549 [Streptomyces cinnabarinus]|uniref:Secreted protein n=1 Tax=Streptomyces cinnabarinus TaxID=67287 RepID=A0ABY7KFD5_9ACTN|nr:hypothetical protein [Streptomyces cinnabarinus]WAZ23218.1 hypothetical protein STRCI_004549 [Streptomyces cinnabarinus]
MPRGRHRHSPPLHRLLPPSAIAGVSVVCALGPWAFSEPLVLRGLAAAAAATAVIGAVVMRRWDTQAGKRVADLVRARASDEWRFEERVAELETDLDESRELRGKLEQRLRAKRAELAGLRNEHASLLRRYATAETERASALEGRRLLEIEAAEPARALPPGPVSTADEADSEPDEGSASASVEASASASEEAGAVAAPAVEADADAEVEVDSDVDAEDEASEPTTPAIFSPEGSRLFLRARAALSKLDGEEPPKPKGDGSAQDDGEPQGDGEAKGDGAVKAAVPVSVGAEAQTSADAQADVPAQHNGSSNDRAVQAGSVAQEDEAQGKPEAVDGQEHVRAAATTTGKPALPAQQPAGHFIAPTAVAVVPSTPARRPKVEGGFDFFGTHKGDAPALEDVQNEDLADVVGQEALALHKAESEAEFKPVDEGSRGIGQVIDLTAHDETEQIDVQGLRSAVS